LLKTSNALVKLVTAEKNCFQESFNKKTTKKPSKTVYYHQQSAAAAAA